MLVCGLGRLGQHCAILLKELGIPVFGLQDVEPDSWEIEGMPDLLDRYTVGDCQRKSTLARAGLMECRAALFTAGDERSNIRGALAARSLNPGVRLVIRSSQANLNRQLTHELGNLAALDIASLPATAFALAAIGDEIVGLLGIDGEFLRVMEKRITADDRWVQGRELRDLNTRWWRVLQHSPGGARLPLNFQGWDPRETVQPGDILAYMEFYQPLRPDDASATRHAPQLAVPTWNALVSRLKGLWSGASQTRRAAALTAAALICLHATGMLLYKLQYPEVSLLDAFNVATVLIFDGYSNMFAQLKLPFPISLWMLLFSLAMTMSGAVVTGMVYAFITARVLSARLEFRWRPGRIPRGKHVVVVGLGPLGRRVAELLTSLRQTVVGLNSEAIDLAQLPMVPVITGDPRKLLNKANCATASSLLALTDDDVANLELALMAAQVNASCKLVIRSDDAEFGRNAQALAPHTQALSIYALSAEAFAAAALGERILNLLRIGHETVLTTEFTVERGDTLDGRILAEVTCGYGLAAILYQRTPGDKAEFFPPEDIRLQPGNRLVVLATIGGLQNGEHGTIAEKTHQVRISSVRSTQAAFEGARTISRITGCELGSALALLSAIPAMLEQPLYGQQALRLVRELGADGVEAEVLPVGTGRGDTSTHSG